MPVFGLRSLDWSELSSSDMTSVLSPRKTTAQRIFTERLTDSRCEPLGASRLSIVRSPGSIPVEFEPTGSAARAAFSDCRGLGGGSIQKKRLTVGVHCGTDCPTT